ncbi:MAG: hypothetical protein ISS25_03080 [Nanoarchaeota archaeon]|nr:hypothetical protein [DPANN group archaeon]MBL7116784.1 hypothetical protein [Nanoarchaeota archaeon]
MMKRKTKAFFANQQMQETLESLITRIELLEDITIDLEKFDRGAKGTHARKIFKGYLTKTDFNYIRKQQARITDLRKSGNEAIRREAKEIESMYIQEILGKVIPEEEIRTLANEMVSVLGKLEFDMIDFIEHKLIPKLFVDRRNRSLDYYIIHMHEVRCNTCDEVTLYDTETESAIMDKDFFASYKKGEVDTQCETRRCKDPEDTFFIAAGNWYFVKNPSESECATKIGGRMKSGGRLLSKFTDRIAGIESEELLICDTSAIRIVTSDEDNALRVLKKLSELAAEYGTNLKGKVRHYNLPREKFDSISKHSAIHIDLPTQIRDFQGNTVYQTFEIQVQDTVGEIQDKKDKNLNHARYVERQENLRRDKWRPIHYELQKQLAPLFERLEYVDNIPETTPEN